jgi:hypothetical protein
MKTLRAQVSAILASVIITGIIVGGMFSIGIDAMNSANAQSNGMNAAIRALVQRSAPQN